MYQVVGCLAVKAALKETIDNLNINLKYPNDVFVEDKSGSYKKISGVLSEHSYSGNRCTETILGIGINVNQKKFESELVDKATSIRLLGYDIDSSLVVQNLKRSLNEILAMDENRIYSTWINELNIIGKSIELVSNKKIYTVIDIDNNGTINAKNDIEEIKINNGDSIVYDLRQ